MVRFKFDVFDLRKINEKDVIKCNYFITLS